ADKSIRITAAESGKVLSIISEHNGAVLDLDVHPIFDHILLSASMDGSHQLLNLETGSPIQIFKDHSKYVTRGRFSPNTGTWLLTASYDRTVNIYHTIESQAETPSYEKVKQLTFSGAVESFCFLTNPGYNDFAVVGVRGDNYLHYIELDEKHVFLHTTYNMNSTGDDWVSFNPMFLASSPNGQFVLCFTDSSAGRLILFKAHSSIQVRNFWGVLIDGFSQPKCCWDTSGNYIYVSGDDYVISVFEVESTQVVAKLEGHQGVIRDLKMDPKTLKLLS
ncbi:hypothetical protein HK096_001361, partial [Nowakowskiella sp. JEL0078]